MAGADSTTSWMVFIRSHAREAAHREGVQPQVQDLLHAEGKNTGSPQALKMWSLWCAAVLLLAGVVVAGHGDHAAVRRWCRPCWRA